MNNTRKQFLNSLKTPNNVVRAVVAGKITQAKAKQIGYNMGLTNAAVNGMLRLSQNNSGNYRGAQALMNISRSGPHRRKATRKATRKHRR